VDFSLASMRLVAELQGLDDPARHELWLQRLEVDRVALDLLNDVRLPQEQGPVDVHTLLLRQPRQQPERRGRLSIADVSDTARRVREGQETALERVEHALGRAKEMEHLHALTALFQDDVRAQAKRLDARAARGEDVGPLAGVTVAVKDIIDVAGRATTGGTRALGSVPADRDAPCVARLRAAGALIIGMANLHPLAYGTLSLNPDFGRVLNPHRSAALAGGSSGGSAAAVAAGIVDVALGTDTAGSVRIPAACCGVVGLKPTFGRIPTAGAYPLSRTLDHVGPLTGSVSDAAALLEVLSEVPFAARDTGWQDLQGLVVGVPQGYVMDHLSPEVRSALEDGKAAVQQAGGTVVDVDVPSLRAAPAAQLYTLAAEAFEVHRDLLRDRAGRLPEDVRLRLEMGMFLLAADYVRAQRLRGLLQKEFDEILAHSDVLLTPTLAVTVPDAGIAEVDVEGALWTTQFALSRLTMPANATGHPALSLPWGTDNRGTPLGLQLVGRPMEEASILGVAGVLERVRDGRGTAPGALPP
jgi:Asp-tRNA(Asn)/Glu-tRNA(Gln) amidotransferase A subunit family amidase